MTARGADDIARAAFEAFEHLCPGGALGVALSGGGDSTALLGLLAAWAGPDLRIEAATVDHRLRHGSADEARAAGRTAAALGMAHRTLEWRDGPGSGNLQSAARTARYALLADWARGAGLSTVLLGHTLDDQAETVLLRLARGAGADGLAAMSPSLRRDGILWLRPLMGLTRADLRLWLSARGLSFVEDPSNDDLRFDRVRARRALAVLAPLGLDARTLASTAARMSQQRAVLEVAADALGASALSWGVCGEAVLDLAAFDAALPETRHRLLARVLQRIGGGAYPARTGALARLARAMTDGTTGTTLAGCLAQTRGSTGWISREPAACARPQPVVAATVWDGRWRIEVAGDVDGAKVGALGMAGIAALRRARAHGDWDPAPQWQPAPVAARCVVPAIRDRAGALVAVPAAAYLAPSARRTGLRVRAKDMAGATDL